MSHRGGGGPIVAVPPPVWLLVHCLLETLLTEGRTHMQSLTTCLMFVGDQFGEADEAMNFYVSLFEDSRVVDVERFGAGEEEPEGAVKRARFLLAGREFIAMDSRSGPTSASEDRRAGPRPRDRQGRPCQATPVTPLLQFPAVGAGESREVLTHCHFPPARLLGPRREKSVNRWSTCGLGGGPPPPPTRCLSPFDGRPNAALPGTRSPSGPCP
jgi:hypothetical protein